MAVDGLDSLIRSLGTKGLKNYYFNVGRFANDPSQSFYHTQFTMANGHTPPYCPNSRVFSASDLCVSVPLWLTRLAPMQTRNTV